MSMTSSDAKMMGMAVSVAAMLVLAPLVATTTLVCWNPGRWGGSVNPFAVLVMSVFGVFTVPLWPTYIPAIVATPLAMQWLSKSRAFARAPMPLLLLLAVPLGAAAGFGIMTPLLSSIETDDTDVWANWAAAGLVSGAVTFSLIVIAHKVIRAFANDRPERSPPPLPRARNGRSDGIR